MNDRLTSGLRAGSVPPRRILVLGDLSGAGQNAAWRAGLLARDNGGWLRILHLPAWTATREAMQRQLDPLAWQLQDDLRIAVVAQSLRAGRRRALAAAIAEADLVVVRAPAAGALRGWLDGLLLERVLRHGGRPVLVVRRPAAVAYRRVLAGVDDDAQVDACVTAASGVAEGAQPQLLRAASAAALLEREQALFADLLVVPHAPGGWWATAPWRQVLAHTGADTLLVPFVAAADAQRGAPPADAGLHGAMAWPS